MRIETRSRVALMRLCRALAGARARDSGAAPLARLKQLLRWLTPLTAAFAALGAMAGAGLRDRPAALGASIVALALALALLRLKFGTRLRESLQDANSERDHLEAALAALQEQEDGFRNLAYHDNLTGLPNRSLFYDRLGLAIRHSCREDSRLAVLFLDVDGFKDVNDSLGHGFGDRLLVELADRIRASVRAEDTVARLGGDEFIVLLPQVTGVADARRVAGKILDALQVPFRLEGSEVSISASLGVSVFPDDGESSENLVLNADRAMYRAKEQGRDVRLKRAGSSAA